MGSGEGCGVQGSEGVVVCFVVGGGRGGGGDGEVVAEGVDEEDDGFGEGGGCPAGCSSVGGGDGNGRMGAIAFQVEGLTCEEEAFGEEV